MPYDPHPATADWFRRALSADFPETRWRAVEMLRDVDGPDRLTLLACAESDRDPRVASTAVLVRAALEIAASDECDDLFESDFAEGQSDRSLQWEWEYSFVVCQGLYAPNTAWMVWLGEEDDEAARRLAMLRASAGVPEPAERTAILIGKRFVNRYTRSPRGLGEAMRWRSEGRPRYDAEG